VSLLRVVAVTLLAVILLVLIVTNVVLPGRGTVAGIRYWNAAETPERLTFALEDVGWERDADAAYFLLSYMVEAQSWSLRRLNLIAPCRVSASGYGRISPLTPQFSRHIDRLSEATIDVQFLLQASAEQTDRATLERVARELRFCLCPARSRWARMPVSVPTDIPVTVGL